MEDIKIIQSSGYDASKVEERFLIKIRDNLHKGYRLVSVTEDKPTYKKAYMVKDKD